MFANREEVLDIVNTSNERTKQELGEQIRRLTLAVSRLEPASVEPFLPVSINPLIEQNNASLDLIKSLPEFKGESSTYPAWRSAAEFAMNYYKEGSERYYVAMGIFRNKIVDSANTTLASFNTVLNYKAIISRLDQTYADKRPLYVLENELSILRQNNLSIAEYYDKVDRQLSLIINKQIMTHSGNNDVVEALNDRARDNALRVFISGLRRPMCDILFSARPKDLPSALAVAQELQMSHMRYDFAQAFAMGYTPKPNNPRASVQQQQPRSYPNVTKMPTPMEVDNSSSFYRQHTTNPYLTQQQHNNNFSKPNIFTYTPKPHISNSNQQFTHKRAREQSSSDRIPIQKAQKINFMPDLTNPNTICETETQEGVECRDYYYSDYSQHSDCIIREEGDAIADHDDVINFLN